MTHWDERKLRNVFKHCEDVMFHVLASEEQAGEGKRHLLIYCEGLCSSDTIQNLVLPRLWKRMELENNPGRGGLPEDMGTMLINELPEDEPEQTVIDAVFHGNVLIFEQSGSKLFVLASSMRPERNPEESQAELTVYGARDCFIEDVKTNVALIRKRLRTNTLHCIKYTLGTLSRTEVTLLYLDGVLNEEVARDIRHKLSKVDVESLLDMESLKNIILKPGLAFFPLMNLTTRPDLVTGSLVKGRFAILMDGNPTVLIAPVNISYMMAVAEDAYTPIPLVYIERFMRRIGFLITVLFPGFWVALTSYHQDQIPLPLLATITVATMGTPLSGPLEILLMILLFQFFLEAGTRLPSALGPSISVVGGLIIGDAIISAGMTSPATLVVAAVSATAQFTLVNGLFGASVGVLRIYIFALASFFGLFGFFTGTFSILIYLANLKSFGVPYLSPYSPISWPDLRYVIFRFPRGKRAKKPQALKDAVERQGRSSE
ncbi:spore germination protein [Paenibacillus sp. TAB 01]|uniref:spore germination protein n=1 Tax=Paenibacillus sp. TAB 01 TaxID=3368988 RepID=UPI003750F41A